MKEKRLVWINSADHEVLKAFAKAQKLTMQSTLSACFRKGYADLKDTNLLEIILDDVG